MKKAIVLAALVTVALTGCSDAGLDTLDIDSPIVKDDPVVVAPVAADPVITPAPGELPVFNPGVGEFEPVAGEELPVFKPVGDGLELAPTQPEQIAINNDVDINLVPAAPVTVVEEEISSASVQDRAVVKIHLYVQTGNYKKSSTSAKINFRLCTDVNDLNTPEGCADSNLWELDEGESRWNVASANTEFIEYNLENGHHQPYMTTKHVKDDLSLYLINVNDMDLRENDEIAFRLKNIRATGTNWLLEGLRVDFLLDDGSTKIAYLNPCAHHWIGKKHPNNEARFSSNDTAFCVVTTAANVDGSTGFLSIEMPVRSEMDGDKLDKTTQRKHQYPSMDSVKVDSASPDRARMFLYWDNFTNFKRGRTTSYGGSFFDGDPILRKFSLKSLVGGSVGSVALAKAEVFIFRPGSDEFLRDSICDYSEIYDKGEPTWIKKKTGGSYPRNGDDLEMNVGAENKCRELKVLGPDSLGGKRI
jgi:hypothetical protein